MRPIVLVLSRKSRPDRPLSVTSLSTIPFEQSTSPTRHQPLSTSILITHYNSICSLTHSPTHLHTAFPPHSRATLTAIPSLLHIRICDARLRGRPGERSEGWRCRSRRCTSARRTTG